MGIEVSHMHGDSCFGVRCAQPKCGEWKTTGECEKNPGYMEENCARTCGKCKKVDKFFPETTTKVGKHTYMTLYQ